MPKLKTGDDLLLFNDLHLLPFNCFVKNLSLLVLIDAHISQALDSFWVVKSFFSGHTFNEYAYVRLELLKLC